MQKNKINYQKILEENIDRILKTKNQNNNSNKPTLLLHACCAPCSTYVLEYLESIFDITVLYYNPNIYPKEENTFRENEIKTLLESPCFSNIKLINLAYEPKEFYDYIKGYEHIKEGGERCERCYKLRLLETAKKAKELSFDYFCTTLSISPLKNAEKLNEIGLELQKEYNVSYLFSDFKKKNGYKRSVELSKEHNLYRQDYCGCIFSKKERE